MSQTKSILAKGILFYERNHNRNGALHPNAIKTT
jgi:hypothetical protein